MIIADEDARVGAIATRVATTTVGFMRTPCDGPIAIL